LSIFEKKLKMSKAQVTNYQGFNIIYLDFTNLKNEEDIISVINESKPLIQNNPPLSLYFLSDISGMHFNNKIREIFTAFTDSNKSYVKASAIVGATGLQNIMINGINKMTGRKLKSFSDHASAKNWLISQN
jgi:hypothetical protein